VNWHWLRVPERIQYKLCVLLHRCLNGAAPQYLSELTQPLSDVDSRRRLRSASTAEVLVPSTRRSTIGDRRPCSCRRWFTCLEQSSSRSAPIPDTFYLQNASEVTSVQHIIPFSLTLSLTILYRALEAACAAYVSLNLSLLHNITFITREDSEEAWDTGGGGRCRKHKFQSGIVIHGQKTFVTPLVAADCRYTRPI